MSSVWTFMGYIWRCFSPLDKYTEIKGWKFIKGKCEKSEILEGIILHYRSAYTNMNLFQRTLFLKFFIS